MGKRYDNYFVAIDTETGGLPNKTQKATIDVALTEVAMVSVDNETLEIKEKTSWLIKPYDDHLVYSNIAAEISGITRELCVKEGLDFQQVFLNIKAFLEKHKRGTNKPIVIFHNKSFDIPFLENLFLIFGDDFNKYVESTEDTLPFARMKWVEKPNFKLGSVAEYCGLDLVEAHRALPDAIITAKIWIHFMKCLRNEVNSGVLESGVEQSFRNTFKF